MMSWFLKLAFVLGICAVSATAKAVEMEDVSESEMTAEEEALFVKMATVMLKAKAVYGLNSDASSSVLVERGASATGDCSVEGDVGTCCGSISVPINFGFWSEDIGVNACLTVDYIPENYGVHITLVVNDQTIINQEVSAVNPPAVCADIVKFVTACVKLSDIQISSNGDFHACVSLLGQAFSLTVTTLKLGCVDF